MYYVWSWHVQSGTGIHQLRQLPPWNIDADGCHVQMPDLPSGPLLADGAYLAMLHVYAGYVCRELVVDGVFRVQSRYLRLE